MFSLVVFDLDGTLIDSLGDLCVAVNRLVAERGGRAIEADAVARMVGEGAGLLVARAVAAAGLADDAKVLLPRFLEIYDSLLPGDTKPYDGVREVLSSVPAGTRLAVLTNKPADATRKILDELALVDHFDGIIGGDGPFPRKPHPHGLQHLMARAGVTGPETLLVGDSTVDLLTAQAAGTRVCIARYGFGQATFDASALRGDEWFVDSPGELLQVIAA